MPLVKVAEVSDLPVGSAKEYVVGDQVLAVYHVDGQYYALDGICPHAGGPLAEGTVQGTTVTCPWHGWQFDVSSGKNCLNPRMSHKAFRVEVQGTDLYVDL